MQQFQNGAGASYAVIPVRGGALNAIFKIALQRLSPISYVLGDASTGIEIDSLNRCIFCATALQPAQKPSDMVVISVGQNNGVNCLLCLDKRFQDRIEI